MNVNAVKGYTCINLRLDSAITHNPAPAISAASPHIICMFINSNGVDRSWAPSFSRIWPKAASMDELITHCIGDSMNASSSYGFHGCLIHYS